MTEGGLIHMAYHLCNSEVNTWILAWNDMLPGDQGVMFSVSLSSDAKNAKSPNGLLKTHQHGSLPVC